MSIYAISSCIHTVMFD